MHRRVHEEVSIAQMRHFSTNRAARALSTERLSPPRSWGIADLVDFSLCGDEVAESKPSPVPLYELADRASVHPRECVVVGDTVSDSGMGRSGGAGLVVGVLTGSGTEEQLLSTGAHVVVPDVGCLTDLLLPGAEPISPYGATAPFFGSPMNAAGSRRSPTTAACTNDRADHRFGATNLRGTASWRHCHPGIARRMGRQYPSSSAMFLAKTVDGGESGTEERKKTTRAQPSTRKRRKPSSSTEPSYWCDESDPLIIVRNDRERVYHGPTNGAGDKVELGDRMTVNGGRKGNSIKFTVRGNPRVLIRHRTARGFVYNPSRAAQDLFRDCLLQILPRNYHPTILDGEYESDDGNVADGDGDTTPEADVLFPSQEFLKLSILFRMKRPKSHFVSNDPSSGSLKSSAPGKLGVSSRCDVDNLAKFVMDSLNGVLYADDRQVVHLDVRKVLDSEGACRGATEVEIRTLDDDDV